jgi:hypothetical protein
VSLAEPSLTPIRTVDGYLPLEDHYVLSIRGDEAEEAWRVEPVLAAWREQRVPLLEYEAGSSGPSARSTSSRAHCRAGARRSSTNTPRRPLVTEARRIPTLASSRSAVPANERSAMNSDTVKPMPARAAAPTT